MPLLDRQQAFGYTQEDIKFLMEPMALQGEEAIGSMGNDAPLAVLSDRNKPLYNYFKQLFAQVTNPPIDPIREQLVMSLVSFIGPKPNLLDINKVNPPMRLEVSQPVLDFDDMAKMREIEKYTSNKFRSFELDICYPLAWGKEGVEARLASLCAEAVDAIRGGYNILIITDRALGAEHVAIPALLATSAVHQHLVARACAPRPAWWSRPAPHARCITSPCWPATAPRPCIRTWRSRRSNDCTATESDKAINNYIKAIGKGLSKVMSKMGISTYMSYCGAQIFEAIGLNRELVDKYFRGTASNVGGIGLFEVMEEAMRMHRAAFSDDPVLAGMLDAGGEYHWRVRGEEHMWTPDAIAKLQHSARANSYQTYKEYAQLINDQSRRHMTLRGLFEFKVDPTKAIPLDEVEPAKEIVKRFATGAMSLGSISTEAHTTLAVAMNRIGGKSNTGEGGEDRRATAGAEGHPGSHRRHARQRARRRPRRGRHSAAGRRLTAQQDQAGGLGPLRRDDRVPGQRRPDPDQDGAGRQARRGRPVARRQGQRIHRQAALLGAGRRPDLAPAAPRHLFDRRPGAADPRPEERQSAGVDQREAGVRSRRRHDRGRRGQGQGRPRGDRRPRRRHRRVAGVVDQARRHAVGTGPGRNAADAGAEPPARPHRRAGRRPDEDRPRRRDRRAARAPTSSASPPRRWWSKAAS